MKSLKAKFRKTDANEWNKNDERLLAAVENGEVEKVAPLLAKKGANAVKFDSEGKSALHVAACRGQADCLAAILAHGADLTAADAAGFTALHLAAKNNHVECCRRLIQSKCPVDALDGSGKTALHHAAASGNIQIVQLLCELKSPINVKDADGVTPLLLSAKHNHPEVCSILLDFGAEINTSDNAGRTALMLATEFNAVSVVEVLVQRGADLSAVDTEGHDVVHYTNASGNSEAKSILMSALNRNPLLDAKSPKSPQSSGPSSPSVVTSTGTPTSNKSDTLKRFNYKEDDIRGTALRGEVEKLHEERNMLLETIDDLKQMVETVSGPPEVNKTASASLVSALQAKITALTLENQQLASKLKKHPSLQGNEKLTENSRPSSMTSNSSFHSTQDEFDSQTPAPANTHVEGGNRPEAVSVQVEKEESEAGSKEEIELLGQTLESLKMELLETKRENILLQEQLKSEQGREREDDGSVQGKEKEGELMESLAELQAKLTDTQERYHQAMEEVEDLRAQMRKREGESTQKQEVQKHPSSTLEHEVTQLRAQLVQSQSERDKAAERIRQLEEVLKRTEEDRQMVKEQERRTAEIKELHTEAQEEVKELQKALKGFEEMKAEKEEVIDALQRRLLEMSQCYSEMNSQLSATQKLLAEAQAEISAASSAPAEQQVQGLSSKVEELQASLGQTERKYSAAQEDITRLRQKVEVQAQNSVALTDHQRVMSSMGNAIKEMESELEALKEQLHQKTMQAEALQMRTTNENDVTPDDSVSRVEHESVRERLEGDANHLRQLLQDALRKQDEMALEMADVWQKARDNSAEREALQELLMSREKENQTLTSRLAESQDAVCQLKQLEENHVASEREKNKRIDDLSREVVKLKDALSSLVQHSYSSCSPSKRQQQSQQLETLQQQIKQLQYQLAESKKQHNEIVSVYRMHLLYAVQGQMDEDVQKALKQILMMCKMPSQAKEAC
ncbi:ankycorbin isoform 2-T2 [Odontesthes bonariensis]|uniref:ankycorbin isoform X2 n=1 Tax=Odontesthes bonariensis TaxID=219752 RepID=UPI003F58A84F